MTRIKMKEQIIEILATTDFLSKNGKESAAIRIVEAIGKAESTPKRRQRVLRELIDTIREIEDKERLGWSPRFLEDVRYALLELLDETKGGVPVSPGAYFDSPARTIAKSLCVDDLLSLADSDAPERFATEEASADEIRAEIKAVSNHLVGDSSD